ncbi:hypothetical protein GGR56DRAFT_632500 [Xylariaceae sp. FL0804]|nr:hypothetical protein GGR56DRAFT_632500 [Xylariaceae sp. FL0804]
MAAARSSSAPFRIGSKQVFLPRHVITFLRPKEGQPADMATFKVPLRFNKLDMRDYLLHCYGVATRGVRSQLRQQPASKKEAHGRITRGPPIKTMTVELERPFRWPAVPEDLTPWNPEGQERRHRAESAMRDRQEALQKRGEIRLRDTDEVPPARLSLRTDAQELLAGKRRWNNRRTLDPKFGEDVRTQGKEGAAGQEEGGEKGT